MGDETVDPTTEASLQNAATNAGLSDRPGVPLTSGDLDATEPEATEPEAEAEGDKYDAMNGEQLSDELRDRTDDEGNPLKISGTVTEQRERLRAADQGVY